MSLLRLFLMILPGGLCLIDVPFLSAEDPVRTSSTGTLTDQDWPWWRGPQRNGVASADQKPPQQWSS